MPGQKRCFITVRALKRLDEVLLCDVLRKFPEFLHRRELRLPDAPDRQTLNYEAIRDVCLADDIPAELDDVLFFVSLLGKQRGQDRIEQEARSEGGR